MTWYRVQIMVDSENKPDKWHKLREEKIGVIMSYSPVTFGESERDMLDNLENANDINREN